MIDGKQVRPQTITPTQIKIDADLDAHNHKIINVTTPAAGGDAANKSYVDGGVAAAIAAAGSYTDAVIAGVGTSVVSNKNMTANVTVADFDEACSVTIVAMPKRDGYVEARVNGLGEAVGDGVKTLSCYFSGDGGSTARAIAAIAAGDKLYWVGSVAGYQLATTDKIDFLFSA
jgi:hypothetical protein